MSSPISTAYSDLDRALSPYLRHRPPRIQFPGLDIPAHPEYLTNWPLWRTIRDCYDGEHVIKAAGETYLRRLTAHKRAEEYEGFLQRAYFYNAVRRTAVGLMGSIFRKKPEFTIPASVPLELDNVTLDGQTAEEFCREIAHDVVLTGRYGILADLPEDGEGNPYLAGYTAESIYSWRVSLIRGRRVLDRVVLRESELVQTEYGEEYRDVVRVLRLDLVSDAYVYSQEIIRPSADETLGPQIQRIKVSVLGRSLDYIPFVFVNAKNNLPAVSVPPLLDIATINISHYQSTALLEHARFYAGMPTYVTTAGEGGGSGEGEPQTMSALTVGPSNVWELEHGATAKIMEFTGHGLVFIENAVDSKQLQMQSLGGKLISANRRAAALSSEAWQLLETGDEATLMDVAMSVEAGMSKALGFLADLRSLRVPEDNPILVELNKEFVRTDLTARELRAIQSLYERQLIPQDVLYYALREVNVIPIEYSLEDFKKLMGQKSQLYEAPLPPQIPGAPAPGQPPRPTLSPRGRPPSSSSGSSGDA